MAAGTQGMWLKACLVIRRVVISNTAVLVSIGFLYYLSCQDLTLLVNSDSPDVLIHFETFNYFQFVVFFRFKSFCNFKVFPRPLFIYDK